MNDEDKEVKTEEINQELNEEVKEETNDGENDTDQDQELEEPQEEVKQELKESEEEVKEDKDDLQELSPKKSKEDNEKLEKSEESDSETKPSKKSESDSESETKASEKKSVKDSDSEYKATESQEKSDSDDIKEVEKTPKRSSRRRKSKNSPAKKKEPEIVELSSNDDSESENKESENKDDSENEDSESSEDVDEIGDPKKPPGEGSSKEISPDHLQPFLFGWKREVVFRRSKKSSVTQCDIYYHPPQDGRYRTREAKRKRRSKADQERYFVDFPDENLSTLHFNYVKKPLGLENAAYEVVRKAKYQKQESGEEASPSGSGNKKSMKEVEESAGLLEDSGDENEEIKLIMGFDLEMPLSLQAFQHTTGMQNEFKKRKKCRDPETSCTPPLVEDSLWTNLDDDPFGVFSELGGRSSPVTPPPLRAVKLTYHNTAEKITENLDKVKKEAFKHEATKEIELSQDLASHDAAIKKFKNYKTSTKIDPTWFPTAKTREQVPKFIPKFQFSQSLIMRPQMDRPCTPKCPGSYGILPSMQCVACKAMFHAKCQGAAFNRNLTVFRCRRCLAKLAQNRAQNVAKQGQSRTPQQRTPQQRTPQQRVSTPRGPYNKDASVVKMKLPMMPKNGKRPIVELVLRTVEGRYQPIKFRNNSQINETIPRTLFHKVNLKFLTKI